MNLVRIIVAAPLLLVGVVLFSIGLVMLLGAHYIRPDLTMFDGWIDRLIDGSKGKEARTPTPPAVHRVATA